MVDYQYQVGGSLQINAPSYVARKADNELYEALRKGEFCYVLNSRQMGKSSLRVRVKYRLKSDGYSCVSLDVTSIGSQNITPQQWYKGIVSELVRGFNLLGKINLKSWWKEREELSSIQILQQFIEEVVLIEIPSEKIFIFIDEIDSILSLNFSSDDFFAFIRFCYNNRSDNFEYNRLTFAIFGVATPSNLIKDRARTPFNIGQSIQLQGFQLEEIKPLAKGLTGKVGNPQAVVRDILFWTKGQPFLTQKLCNLVREYADSDRWKNFQVGNSIKKRADNKNLSIAQILRRAKITYIVENEIINNWEFQDEPEHLRTIRDRLLKNERRAGRILEIYQQILQQGDINVDDSLEQIDLLLSGLVIKERGKLQVNNPIYKKVYNYKWVEKELKKRRPYSENLQAWLDSEARDESRLLRGKALAEAQNWTIGKSLSDRDYQFLAASQELDKKRVADALKSAETANKILAEAQTKAKQIIRRGTIGFGTISLLAVSLLIVAVNFSLQAVKQQQKVDLNQIKNLTIYAKALIANQQEFDALLTSLEAAKKFKALDNSNFNLKSNVENSLQEAIYWVKEKNHLRGHQNSVLNTIYSPDGKLIVSADRDGKVKIWNSKGKLLQTLAEHQDAVWNLSFSPDSNILVTVSEDKTIKIWQRDRDRFKLFKTLTGHQSWVVSAVYCSKIEKIVSASWDGTVKIWSLTGEEISSFKADPQGLFYLSISPNQEIFASAGIGGTIKLWDKTGKLLKTLKGHQDWIFYVTFSPDGKYLASASRDGIIKLWSIAGEELKSFRGHNAAVFRIAFSPDSKAIASASWDTMVKLWDLSGREIDSFKGHQDSVWSVNFSPDGKYLITGSEDRSVKLWQRNNPTITQFQADRAAVRDITFSADGKTIATAGLDFTVKLFNLKGKLLQNLDGFNAAVRDISFSHDGKTIAIATWGRSIELWRKNRQGKYNLDTTLTGHQGAVWSVNISSDGKTIVSGSEDKSIALWDITGKRLNTITGHLGGIFSVNISPDGKQIVSGGEDKTVKLWQLDGTFVRDFSGHQDWVISVGFSPDGKMIYSVGREGTIKIWDLDGKEYLSLKSPQDSIWSASVSPDGKTIASGSFDGSVKLWDVSGRTIKTLQGHKGAVRSVSISPDGKMLASADSLGNVIIWNLDPDTSLSALTTKGCNWVRDYLENNNSQLCQSSDP